ncbi:hypothetical protein [Bradyrhizobium sp. WSM471]|uniref:hypothetical protein n=1 Tax=Bradyrhizobium sp. WSM471 TaxID=319017 RepID=UPI00024D1E4B|nr:MULTISPECIES: hypothetical protein [Bradyrhizobium]EHR01107.1 hypothetical protein Bra471DRAFT_01792 [Bradyrhizobium sp. WSM471]UFW43168.1 hypothetical protein BcanWSM471_08795 [Bradyrhizobium canariense]
MNFIAPTRMMNTGDKQLTLRGPTLIRVAQKPAWPRIDVLATLKTACVSSWRAA